MLSTEDILNLVGQAHTDDERKIIELMNYSDHKNLLFNNSKFDITASISFIKKAYATSSEYTMLKNYDSYPKTIADEFIPERSVNTRIDAFSQVLNRKSSLKSDIIDKLLASTNETETLNDTNPNDCPVIILNSKARNSIVSYISSLMDNMISLKDRYVLTLYLPFNADVSDDTKYTFELYTDIMSVYTKLFDLIFIIIEDPPIDKTCTIKDSLTEKLRKNRVQFGSYECNNDDVDIITDYAKKFNGVIVSDDYISKEDLITLIYILKHLSNNIENLSLLSYMNTFVHIKEIMNMFNSESEHSKMTFECSDDFHYNLPEYRVTPSRSVDEIVTEAAHLSSPFNIRNMSYVSASTIHNGKSIQDYSLYTKDVLMRYLSYIITNLYRDKGESKHIIDTYDKEDVSYNRHILSELEPEYYFKIPSNLLKIINLISTDLLLQ